MELKEEVIRKMKDLGEEVKFNMGDVILREGEKADKVFIILSGHVSVFKKGPGDDEVFIGIAGPGSVFGEMSAFLEGERTATVRASSAVTVLMVNTEDFLSAISHFPELAYTLLREFSKRVNNLNRRVVSIMTSKFIYVIGMYLLENVKMEESPYYESEEGKTEFSVKRFCTEYGLEPNKVEGVLAILQKAGIVSIQHSNITTEDGREEIIYTVKFNPNKLKAYLRSVAYV